MRIELRIQIVVLELCPDCTKHALLQPHILPNSAFSPSNIPRQMKHVRGASRIKSVLSSLWKCDILEMRTSSIHLLSFSIIH
jgi:hypothetical protein